MLGTPAVGIGAFRPERGDLDVSGFLRADNDDHAEAGSDRQGAPPAEQLADGLGTPIGGDVVVLRDAAHQKIANAAAGP